MSNSYPATYAGKLAIKNSLNSQLNGIVMTVFFTLYLQTSEMQNELARHSSVGANGKIIPCNIFYCILHGS